MWSLGPLVKPDADATSIKAASEADAPSAALAGDLDSCLQLGSVSLALHRDRTAGGVL